MDNNRQNTDSTTMLYMTEKEQNYVHFQLYHKNKLRKKDLVESLNVCLGFLNIFTLNHATYIYRSYEPNITAINPLLFFLLFAKHM